MAQQPFGLTGFAANAAYNAELAQQQAQQAEQQAQALIEQERLRTQQYEDQLAALAQQEAAMRQQQAQAAQASPLAAPNDGTRVSTGNPIVDRFAAEMDEGLIKKDDRTLSGDNATLWNRQMLDDWLSREAAANKWNDNQKSRIRKMIVEKVRNPATGESLFEVKERGWLGFAGDQLNAVVDSGVIGVGDLLASANALTYRSDASPVRGVEKMFQAVGLGDGKLNWDKAGLDAVQAVRDKWTGLRSDQAKDSSKAVQQARGVAETITALSDEPAAAVDLISHSLGVIIGPKLGGAATRAIGEGIATRAATRIAENTLGVGSKHLLDGTRLAAGNALAASGRALENNLLAAGAALEGGNNAAAQLRHPYAYDETTGQFHDDALTSAALAGAGTAATTYLMGRFTPTLEGTLATRLGTRSATPLGRVTLHGQTQIDDAMRRVGDDLARGAPRDAAASLQAARDLITSAAGRRSLRDTLPGDSALKKLLGAGGTVGGSMLAEGFEEGVVGLIANVAQQGLRQDGTWAADNINWSEAADAFGSAATLGAVLGVFGGGMQLHQRVRQDEAVMQQTLARYNEQAATLDNRIHEATEVAATAAAAEETVRSEVDALRRIGSKQSALRAAEALRRQRAEAAAKLEAEVHGYQDTVMTEADALLAADPTLAYALPARDPAVTASLSQDMPSAMRELRLDAALEVVETAARRGTLKGPVAARLLPMVDALRAWQRSTGGIDGARRVADAEADSIAQADLLRNPAIDPATLPAVVPTTDPLADIVERNAPAYARASLADTLRRYVDEYLTQAENRAREVGSELQSFREMLAQHGIDTAFGVTATPADVRDTIIRRSGVRKVSQAPMYKTNHEQLRRVLTVMATLDAVGNGVFDADERYAASVAATSEFDRIHDWPRLRNWVEQTLRREDAAEAAAAKAARDLLAQSVIETDPLAAAPGTTATTDPTVDENLPDEADVKNVGTLLRRVLHIKGRTAAYNNAKRELEDLSVPHRRAAVFAYRTMYEDGGTEETVTESTDFQNQMVLGGDPDADLQAVMTAAEFINEAAVASGTNQRREEAASAAKKMLRPQDDEGEATQVVLTVTANAAHTTSIPAYVYVPQPGGTVAVPATTVVMEADALDPSVTVTTNQLRNRTRDASSEQVTAIARNMHPDQLAPSVETATGAPVLAQDGRIISGNGRTLGIRQHYAEGMTDYRDYVIRNAVAWGLDPDRVAAMRQPVVVRRLNQPVDVEAAAIGSNEGSLGMSALEQAQADAARLPDLSDMEMDATGGISREFVRRFAANLGVNARANFIDRVGHVSQEGMTRTRNAVLFRAFGDSPVLSRIIETADPSLRNLSTALTRSAPAIAAARDAIAQGHLHDADIAADITEAAERLHTLKTRREDVDEALRTGALFDEYSNPVADRLLEYFNRNLSRWTRISQLLTEYYALLAEQGSPQQGDMLGGVTVDKLTLLNMALESSAVADTVAPEQGGFTFDAAAQQQGIEFEMDVLAATRDRYRSWIARTFGPQTAQSVTFVAPHSAPNPSTNGYTIDSDPSHLFIVLHPGRTESDVLWTVAHEMLHNGVTVRFPNGKTATAAEYTAAMEPFASHPYVQRLTQRMRETRPDTYGALPQAKLVEEALAEVWAAQRTRDFAQMEERWGADMALPTGLRSDKPASLVGRVVEFLRRMVAALTGRRRASDRDVNNVLRNAVDTTRQPVDVPPAPQAVQQYVRAVSFDATLERVAYYREQARAALPDFDRLPADERQRHMAGIARQYQDTRAEQELSFQYDEGVRAAAEFLAAEQDAARRRAADSTRAVVNVESFDPDLGAANATLNPDPRTVGTTIRSVSDAALRSATHASAQAVYLYPFRSSTPDYDPSVTDYPVGVIGHRGGLGEVVVKINSPVYGQWEQSFQPQDGETFADTMQRAQDAVQERYGINAFQRRSAVAAELDAYKRNFPNAPRKQMEVNDYHILNRKAFMQVEMPQLRRITDRLQRYIPDNWIPALDAVMDFLYAMRVRWVDAYSAARDTESAYNRATGQTGNIIDQMLADLNHADAWLARKSDKYEGGTGFKNNWTTMTFSDGTHSIYEMIKRTGRDHAAVERDLYAISEMLRYQELLHERGHTDATGQRTLHDPSSLGGARLAESVTGFRYAGWDSPTTDKGAYDLGAKKWLEDFRQRPLEERKALGRVVAAVAALNRAVLGIESSNGVLTFDQVMYAGRRGKIKLDPTDVTLDQMFPEVVGEGYDMGGFFLTMRDPDNKRTGGGNVQGRTSTVPNPLKTTQELLIRRVRRAVANKELVNFTRLVVSMPNKHFAADPARAVVDENGDVVWERTDKDVKAAVRVVVDGVPHLLVAKTDAAAAVLKSKAPHPFFARFGTINHFFNAFKTTLNISYVPVGFTRDLMTGFLNISGAIGEQYVGTNDATRVGMDALKYAILSMPNTARATLTNKGHSPWLSLFQSRGAGMFFGDIFNPGAFRGETVSTLTHNPLVQGARRVVETIGYTPESAMRMGAFRAYMEHLFPELRDGNVTEKRLQRIMDDPANRAKIAAVIQGTKNITSNFQQHGSDNVVRYMFSFFNAVMQGTFSTLPQILSTAHGRKYATILLIAFAAAAAKGVEDEEVDEFGNSKYFHNIGRNRAIILGDDRIPVTDEMGLFKVAIENIVGLLAGKRNMVDAIVDTASAAGHMVSPNEFGATGNIATDLMYGAMPTMTHGFIGLATGKDIFGRDLKSQYAYDAEGRRIQDPTDVERTTQRATQAGTDLAQALYRATGGTVDASGDEVDYFLRSYLAGVYNLVSRSYTASMRDGDGTEGVAGTIVGEATRGFRAIKIDRTSARAWDALKERVAVSLRNPGSTLDVMNAEEDAGTLAEAAALIRRIEREQKEAVSEQGRTVKQVRDMMSLAERDGRWADVRDLQAELNTIWAERDRIKAEGIREAIELGVL